MKSRAVPFPIRIVSLAVFLVSAAHAAADIEILRDRWGVPHIFADSDEGAFYGLGYAAAEDRGFQMTFTLRIIQGRLSEAVGEVRSVNRADTSVDHDRKMRTFGFYRAAQRVAAALDPDTRALLQAYCDGVNEFQERRRDDLHPLFGMLEMEPEPWTPADCIASWWRLGQFFATDGTRDLVALRGQGADRPAGRAAPGPAGVPGTIEKLPPDDAAAVVRRADLSPEWIARVEAYARDAGIDPPQQADGAAGPEFSHAWVVGGSRTTTGSAVLVSDPQTPVRNPSLFHEFHVQGKTFNARGVGVPGSPIILVGFTERVAWGVTALGADQADLFLLETDPRHPDQYRFDDAWRPMTVRRERIRIRGREPVDCIVRETHLGPVATAFCFARPGDGEVALKRVPVCETDRETVQGAIAMLRAGNAAQFDAALEGWRFPSVNILFGDRDGNIGYRALAAIPVRSRLDTSAGRHAAPARSGADDWQGVLPFDLLPHVMNPSAGYLFSGNHRAIESWYPIPFGAATGQGGDTVRSWRLRELLRDREVFAPEDVRRIHDDAVNPARREIVRIGLHLRAAPRRDLSDDARSALALLEPWLQAGASSDLACEGAALAMELNTFFRFANTGLAHAYGGGESGLTHFLKTAAARIEGDPAAGFSDIELDYIDQSLAGAWQSALRKHGDDPSAWNEKARGSVTDRVMGYCEGLDGFPSLDPGHDLTMPALTVVDGGVIRSQATQAYTQWVPMHDPDTAMSLLPPGQSERIDSPWRTSAMDAWTRGELRPAPLSRARVESIAVSRLTLAPRAHGPRPPAPYGAP